MKKGLIMEGGAMRGMFTAGVIDVFMENGIEFDGAVGVSAGATFGCNIKSKQPGRAVRYNMKYCKDPRYGTFKSLLKTGDLYEAKFCYETLPFELDPFDVKTFAANPLEFYCVVTDAKSGKPVYHRCKTGTGKDMDWIRASASMPLVSKLVEIDGGYYSDGGASDSIPLKFFESKGFDKNVVILTRDRNYRKEPDKLSPFYKVIMPKHKGLAKAMANRPAMYNAQKRYIEQREKEGKAFLIFPPQEIDISRTEHDPKELKRIYDMGRKTAMEKLADIKKYLAG